MIHCCSPSSRPAPTLLWTPASTGAPYGSDLRLYANAGIPTLQLGPGDVAAAHSADEYVPLADLVDCARSYAVLALRMGR